MANQLIRKEFKNAFRVFCSGVSGFLFRHSGFSVPASVFSVLGFNVPGFLFRRSGFSVPVSTFENPAKGRPQTSSLKSAVIRQKVNKMGARKRTLTVEDVVRIVSTKQSNSVASESQSNSFSTVLNKTLDELID